MKVRWIRLCRWLLGVLGLGVYATSCDTAKMYGPLPGEYEMKDRVVDSESGEGDAGQDADTFGQGKSVTPEQVLEVE